MTGSAVAGLCEILSADFCRLAVSHRLEAVVGGRVRHHPSRLQPASRSAGFSRFVATEDRLKPVPWGAAFHYHRLKLVADGEPAEAG